MEKSEKELAFLRDFYVASEWTPRFTSIFDEKYKITNEETFLYVNAGAGNHALALREIIDEKAEITAICENEELLRIAKAKALAIKADINFTTLSPFERFNLVLANASHVKAEELPEFISEVVNYSDESVVFYLPTWGSFGEVFSFLWEALLSLDMLDKSEEVEKLISDLPTLLKIEEILKGLKLKGIESATSNEVFEYKNGAEFLASPLIADFLLPKWLEFLDKKEKDGVKEALAKIIDENQNGIDFTFTLKASLVKAKKK